MYNELGETVRLVVLFSRVTLPAPGSSSDTTETHTGTTVWARAHFHICTAGRMQIYWLLINLLKFITTELLRRLVDGRGDARGILIIQQHARATYTVSFFFFSVSFFPPLLFPVAP